MALKKIKEQNKDYNISILDLLRIIDPSKTGKFMNLIIPKIKIYGKNSSSVAKIKLKLNEIKNNA